MNWKDAPRLKLPEVAFVGRSNVGKSSLINALINSKNLARVSKQPGKTRTINYFAVDEWFYLVDLPGYGFARTSKEEQLLWQEAIEGYLLNSQSLRMLFVLIDGKVGAKKNDVQVIEWLRFNKIPFQVVATKSDRISRNVQLNQAKAISTVLELTGDPSLIFSSAKDRSGRGTLWRAIQRIVNAKA